MRLTVCHLRRSRMGRVRAARLLARQQAIFPATYGLQPPKTSRHPRHRAGLSVSWDQRVRFDTHHDSSTVGNASQSKGHSRLLGASTEASEQQGFLPQSFTPDAGVDLGGLRFKRETGRMPLLEACWLRCPRQPTGSGERGHTRTPQNDPLTFGGSCQPETPIRP